MNDFINPQTGALTVIGVTLHDEIAEYLRSQVTEHRIDPITLSYIAHQAIESVTAEMVIDARYAKPTQRSQLFGEVA
jgi:hypothetical protein